MNPSLNLSLSLRLRLRLRLGLKLRRRLRLRLSLRLVSMILHRGVTFSCFAEFFVWSPRVGLHSHFRAAVAAASAPHCVTE